MVSQICGKTDVDSAGGRDTSSHRPLLRLPVAHTQESMGSFSFCFSAFWHPAQILPLFCCFLGSSLPLWIPIKPFRPGISPLVNSLPPSTTYNHIYSPQSIPRFLYLWSLFVHSPLTSPCFSTANFYFPSDHKLFPLNFPGLGRLTRWTSAETHIITEASRVLLVERQ